MVRVMHQALFRRHAAVRPNQLAAANPSGCSTPTASQLIARGVHPWSSLVVESSSFARISEPQPGRQRCRLQSTRDASWRIEAARMITKLLSPRLGLKIFLAHRTQGLTPLAIDIDPSGVVG